LWDEAGTSRGGADAQASRHLSLNHYREIGEFSDALSRHANEILNDLGPGLELAVTQVFSALSELDKEGRAIRRALRFSQLVAETGISEADIRRVLDRFRAEDCSFVTPPRSEVKMIDGTTRIDVGHEALLRRWEKVSGHGIELGWLRAEQQAGERYRGLLAMADSGATLPAHLVDERLAWWKARPRTAAWAERYGGGFESVVRLLQASRRRQRAKLVGVVAAFASVASVALVMFLMWQRAERLQSDADASRKNVVNALNVTKNVVGRLFGSFNDGGTTASFTAQFLEDAKPMLDDLEKNENPPLELSEIRISLLFGFYDARLALGEHDEAQRHAEQAFAISRKLLERYPDNQNLLRHIYSASFRLGDLKAIDFANEEAERHFKVALDFAERRARIKPGDLQVQRDIIFIGNKLADLDSSKSNWQPALDRYTAGLKIAEAIADKSPVDTATQKNRIAQLLSHRKSPGDAEQALATYREALAILTELRRNSPDNATLLSNQALTHRRIGGLLKDKPGEALVEYQAAVANRKKLFERDPGNVPWRLGLATDYKLLGETLLDLKDLRGTQINFALASQLEEGLVLKNPRNIVWQRTSAVTNMKRGDVLLARADEGIASPDPPMDEPTRRIADALLRYQTAEAVFRKLADDPAAGSSRFPNLFNVRFKIGDVLVRQKKYGEALDSFQSALAVASMTGSPSRRFVEWHMKVADRIALACEHLARETAGGPPTAVLASGDQPDRLTCYQKALSAIEAAAAKEPDDVEVKEKRAALSAKIEALRPK
jgi:tetratricopeptide (TPR) repeat protein